jgi:hypothetical protein
MYLKEREPMSNVIASVKIAQKEAGISDKEYRNLLFDVAGVRSSKDLSQDNYKKVLAKLYKIANAHQQAAVSTPKTAQERKIWALWYALVDFLPPQERGAKYLFGFAARVIGVDRINSLATLDGGEKHKIIEALKQRLDQEENRLKKVLKDVPF